MEQWPNIFPHRDVFNTFPDNEWDDLFIFCFPPCTKNDLGIRNIHMTDLLVLSSDFNEDLFWTTVGSLPGKSHIFLCNILLYVFLVSKERFSNSHETGVFNLEEYTLRDCLKGYSDQCKKKDFYEKRRTVSLFIENHNLFGALLPPVEGWDPVKQTKQLAHCEVEPHGLIGTPWCDIDFFTPVVNDCLFSPPQPFDKRDRIFDRYQDFVLYGDWEKSGVSSMGRVKWRYTDKEDPSYSKESSFKARKNFVLDITASDELVETCFGADSFPDNTAIIKSKLAKIRIRVASPLPLYLLESGLLDWANHYYLGWPGSTLEKDSQQEYKRNVDQWNKMCSGGFVLPFDFELFDH